MASKKMNLMQKNVKNPLFSTGIANFPAEEFTQGVLLVPPPKESEQLLTKGLGGEVDTFLGQDLTDLGVGPIPSSENVEGEPQAPRLLPPPPTNLTGFRAAPIRPPVLTRPADAVPAPLEHRSESEADLKQIPLDDSVPLYNPSAVLKSSHRHNSAELNRVVPASDGGVPLFDPSYAGSVLPPHAIKRPLAVRGDASLGPTAAQLDPAYSSLSKHISTCHPSLVTDSGPVEPGPCTEPFISHSRKSSGSSSVQELRAFNSQDPRTPASLPHSTSSPSLHCYPQAVPFLPPRPDQSGDSLSFYPSPANSNTAYNYSSSNAQNFPLTSSDAPQSSASSFNNNTGPLFVGPPSSNLSFSHVFPLSSANTSTLISPSSAKLSTAAPLLTSPIVPSSGDIGADSFSNQSNPPPISTHFSPPTSSFFQNTGGRGNPAISESPSTSSSSIAATLEYSLPSFLNPLNLFKKGPSPSSKNEPSEESSFGSVSDVATIPSSDPSYLISPGQPPTIVASSSSPSLSSIPKLDSTKPPPNPLPPPPLTGFQTSSAPLSSLPKIHHSFSTNPYSIQSQKKPTATPPFKPDQYFTPIPVTENIQHAGEPSGIDLNHDQILNAAGDSNIHQIPFQNFIGQASINQTNSNFSGVNQEAVESSEQQTVATDKVDESAPSFAQQSNSEIPFSHDSNDGKHKLNYFGQQQLLLRNNFPSYSLGASPPEPPIDKKATLEPISQNNSVPLLPVSTTQSPNSISFENYSVVSNVPYSQPGHPTEPPSVQTSFGPPLNLSHPKSYRLSSLKKPAYAPVPDLGVTAGSRPVVLPQDTISGSQSPSHPPASVPPQSALFLPSQSSFVQPPRPFSSVPDSIQSSKVTSDPSANPLSVQSDQTAALLPSQPTAVLPPQPAPIPTLQPTAQPSLFNPVQSSQHFTFNPVEDQKAITTVETHSSAVEFSPLHPPSIPYSSVPASPPLGGPLPLERALSEGFVPTASTNQSTPVSTAESACGESSEIPRFQPSTFGNSDFGDIVQYRFSASGRPRSSSKQSAPMDSNGQQNIPTYQSPVQPELQNTEPSGSGSPSLVSQTPPPIQPFSAMAVSQTYRPVYHHWFYRKGDDKKHIWHPFSMADSLNLEQQFTSEEASEEGSIVATDGGRFDVDVFKRTRTAVYWHEIEGQVRRCSWFVKGPIDSRYQPYDESIATLLEEEYKMACTKNEWNRRVELADGEVIIIHSPNSIAHHQRSSSPDSWGNPPPIAEKPRIVKRGLDEFDIPEGEPTQVDHLLLVVHGVGKVCDLRFRSLVEVVDDFRSVSQTLIGSHYKSAVEKGKVGRVEVLPVEWYRALHTDVIDQRLSDISLPSIPKVRQITNEVLLDILFYTSPIFCERIVAAVGGELNRVYSLYLKRNPGFKGGVSLGGHSLGSLILFDMLCHQKPPHSKFLSAPPSSMDDDDEAVSALGCLKTSARLSRRMSYLSIGTAGTGQPYIEYPQLLFQPRSFFALGSPIGMFITVRGVESLGLEFKFPTCPSFFNIFHPHDPVAYRIEGLINPELSIHPPVLIPHHKGRKRMHLELKETMAHLTTIVKQKLLDSVKNTWNTVSSLTRFSRIDPATIENQVDKVLEDEMLTHEGGDDVASSIGESNEGENIEVNLGLLNGGRRIDYVLQEAPLETFNQYISAIRSHAVYWESEDTLLLILKEIYNTRGITADSQVSQPLLPFDSSPEENAGPGIAYSHFTVPASPTPRERAITEESL